MQLFLTVLSGVCWSVVYIELIRHGLKNKTYGMPLFALGLNFAWEVIYTVDDLAFGAASIQGWVNLAWALLDVIIVYTYFKHGRKYFPEKGKRYFIPFSILAFTSCFVMQFAFYFHFNGGAVAGQYSAFAQNAAMSVLFLTMLFSRGNTQGQSVLMAVAKWIGTLAPAILMGVIQGFNIYIILMGVVCSVFDILYIIILYRWKKGQEKGTSLPQGV